MGNCLRREKSMVWAGDDWESLAPKNIHREEEEETDDNDIERERLPLLLGEECSTSSTGTTTTTSTSSTREVVKIKMTKKQLEELVGRSGVDMKAAAAGLSSVEQVLGQLAVMMKKNDGGVDDYYYEMRRDQQLSWRPVLQSIPEVN